MLVMFGSVGLSSCGGDGEGEVNNGEGEVNNVTITGNNLSGTIRSRIKDKNTLINGQSFSYKTVTRIDFYNDGVSAAYRLFNTESVEFLKREVASDGKLVYDGTWTVMEGHPEWSYFKGTNHIPDLNIPLENGEIMNIPGADIVINTPGLLKYTLNLDSNSLSLEESSSKSYNGWTYLELSDQTLYIDWNSSKTFCSGLKDEYGQLRWVHWTVGLPMDNSMFN